MCGVHDTVVVTWEGNVAPMERANSRIGSRAQILCPSDIKQGRMTVGELVDSIISSKVTLVYSIPQQLFEDLMGSLGTSLESCRIVCLGTASDSALNTVDQSVQNTVNGYLTKGGDENLYRMLDYLGKTFAGVPGEPLPPITTPKDSLIDPDDGSMILSLEEYLSVHPIGKGPAIAVAGTKISYDQDLLKAERELCASLSAHGMFPILFYTGYSTVNPGKDEDLCGAIHKFCSVDGSPIVDAIVKPARTPLRKSGGPKEKSLDWMRELNLPVIHPVMLSLMSIDEWETSENLGKELSWQIYTPELEGATEQIVMGSDIGYKRTDAPSRVTIPERLEKISRKVQRICGLRRKKNSAKKIVIILNNYPCQGAESNIGSAVGLDALESTVRLMKTMQTAGYNVEPPESAEALRDMFFQRKAMSDFRWTCIEDILSNGGALYTMKSEEYARFFDALPDSVRQDMVKTWGEPPGNAMVHNGRIMVTGLNFGNVIVALQPKRGCYGARCDGEVCMMLHNPVCPPTHQFLASYHYFEDIWGADAIIEMGAHGVAENLPGKDNGLSAGCYPDIVSGTVPLIYPYNVADGLSGLAVRRRLYGTLISHMEPVYERAGISDSLKELLSLLEEYDISNDQEQRDMLRTRITGKLSETGLELPSVDDFGESIHILRDRIARISAETVQMGLHVLGDIPDRHDLTEMILTSMTAEQPDNPLQTLCCDLTQVPHMNRKSLGIHKACREFIEVVLEREDVAHYFSEKYRTRLDDDLMRSIEDMICRIISIRDSIIGSDEIGSILNALNGGYIMSGPPGALCDGVTDAVPTGRNLHGLPSEAMPTRAAWDVGRRLADSIIERYLSEHGTYPESVAVFWMLSDHLSTGGETMCQIIRLIGAEPVWDTNGRFNSCRIVPLDELKRPRINISVDISSLLRDGLRQSVDQIDSLVEKISELEESGDLNYLHRHLIKSLEKGIPETEAKARIFGPPPRGTGNAVHLAVYSSAWKDKKDLTELFLDSKSYAYGGKRNGERMLQQRTRVLGNVDITVNATVSRRSDVTTSSMVFADIGGISTAAEYISGKKNEVYNADSSDKDSLWVEGLSDKISRQAQAKLTNPAWIEKMKEHGYRGAAEIASSISTLYCWHAVTGCVANEVFTGIVDTFIRDRSNRQFLFENNRFALEEFERRLLEAYSREIWDAPPETIALLKKDYLDLEGDFEEYCSEGEYQGGEIDIITPDKIKNWNDSMDDTRQWVSDLKK